MNVESAQLLASMRGRLGPQHPPPGHVAELSGTAFRVPLQALHRLEDPLVKEGGDRKVFTQMPRASPPVGCGVPTVIRETFLPCFQETNVIRVKIIQFSLYPSL